MTEREKLKSELSLKSKKRFSTKAISSHRPRYIIGLNLVDETALINGKFK